MNNKPATEVDQRYLRNVTSRRLKYLVPLPSRLDDEESFETSLEGVQDGTYLAASRA